MALNLRLPPDLDARARVQSQTLGISLNALICVALGQYLNQGTQAPPAPSIAPPAPKPPTPPPGELCKAPARKPTKAETRAYMEKKRAERRKG